MKGQRWPSVVQSFDVKYYCAKKIYKWVKLWHTYKTEKNYFDKRACQIKTHIYTYIWTYSSPLPPQKTNKKTGMGGIPCPLLKAKFFLAVAHYRMYDEKHRIFCVPYTVGGGMEGIYMFCAYTIFYVLPRFLSWIIIREGKLWEWQFRKKDWVKYREAAKIRLNYLLLFLI